MTEYRFHWWPRGSTAKLTPSIALEAQSTRHGAALALQRFVELGCDISAAGAHVDVTDPDGVKHTLLVEEVLDWLKGHEQAAFVQSQRLAPLLQQRQA
jgi:hypothetical protein